MNNHRHRLPTAQEFLDSLGYKDHQRCAEIIQMARENPKVQHNYFRDLMEYICILARKDPAYDNRSSIVDTAISAFLESGFTIKDYKYRELFNNGITDAVKVNRAVEMCKRMDPAFDINKTLDPAGNTLMLGILSICSGEHYHEVVDALINHGADPSIRHAEHGNALCNIVYTSTNPDVGMLKLMEVGLDPFAHNAFTPAASLFGDSIKMVYDTYYNFIQCEEMKARTSPSPLAKAYAPVLGKMRKILDMHYANKKASEAVQGDIATTRNRFSL